MKRAWLCLALAACGGGKKAKPEDAAPAPAPLAPKSTAIDAAPKPAPDAAPAAAPAATFPTVKIGDQPLVIVSAFAIPDRNDLKVQLSTWPATCDDHTVIPEGGRSISVTIRRKLRPDGTFSWAHFGTYFEGRSTEGGFGEPLTSSAIQASPGMRAQFEEHETLEAFSDSPALSIDGPIDAEVCKPVEWHYPTPPPDAEPPQPDATITVAGQQLPIVGAAYLPSKKHGFHLMVSTFAVTCTEGGSGMDDTRTFLTSSYPDVSLKLAYAKAYDRKDGQPWSAELDGEWIDQWHNGDGSGLKIEPAKPTGKTETTVTLSGEATIGGYPVAWSGTVHAKVCR